LFALWAPDLTFKAFHQSQNIRTLSMSVPQAFKAVI